MVGVVFRVSGQLQKFFLRLLSGLNREKLRYPEFSFCQRPGLVKNDRRNLGHSLQIVAPFHKNADTGGCADSAEKAERDRNH